MKRVDPSNPDSVEIFTILRSEFDRAAEMLAPDGACYVDVLHAVAQMTSLAAMRPDGRVAYFRSVSAGYCDRCGDALKGEICHCENDE